MKTWVLAVASGILISAVVGLGVYTFQLRSERDEASEERDAARAQSADLTVALDECEEAVALGRELYGELSGAHAELILLYSQSTSPRGTVNPGVTLQEQYGKWQGAEDRLRILGDKSNRFFEQSDRCRHE